MPLDKKQCQDKYAALTCSGNNYNDDFANVGVRKAHAAKFVAANPECGQTADHTAYVTEHSSCSLLGGRRRASRKSRRKSRRASRKGRKTRGRK
jgi:hypothetical protein